MNTPTLKLADLVPGLEYFGERYVALGIFADDIEELLENKGVQGLEMLDEDGLRFRFAAGSKSYDLALFPEAGVARLSRAGDVKLRAQAEAVPGKKAEEAITAARRKKGAAAGKGLLLGLLEGKQMPSGAWRVFTLAFDPTQREWQAYSGGLVQWMKRNLLITPAAA